MSPLPAFPLLRDKVRVAGPGLVTSLALHVVILVILAFVAVRNERQTAFPTTISAFNEYESGTKRRHKAIVPVQIDALKIEPVGAIADNPDTQRIEKAEDAAPPAVRRPSEVNVSGALAARTAGDGGARAGLAGQGGNEKSETAVALGLGWLARQQLADGHWELHQGYPDPGQVRTSTGATALALMVFLGAGHTQQDGPYREKIGKAIDWLLAVQKKAGVLKGDFYDFDREGDAASFYAHGQATIALCEAYALTRNERLLTPIRAALAFIAEAQHPVSGGWKYRRHSEGDLSVFGWQIMALESARMAGLDLPLGVLEKAAGFLDLVQEQEGSRYRYEPSEAKSATPAMTAEGLFCRQYLGWPRDHPALRAGISYLLEPANLPKWNSSRRNVYCWYYAAQVLHNLGGNDWEVWNTAMRDELLKSQAKEGKVAGSWNPFQPAGAVDENADKGGRLYVTCLCLLTLEVYYRHLPLYRP
jgi:hypothetical protein